MPIGMIQQAGATADGSQKRGIAEAMPMSRQEVRGEMGLNFFEHLLCIKHLACQITIRM
jgi:hypothetical protein